MWCPRTRAPRWRRTQIALVALLVAGSVAARSVPAETETSASGKGLPAGQVIRVSWPELVRLVDQHPLVAAGAFGIDAARGAVTAAGAAPNPSLAATAGRGEAVVGDESDDEWALELELPLGWLALRGSRVAAAEADLEATEAESELLRREVLLELRTLFWSLVSEQERVAALEALEQQTAALVATVRKRVEVGEVRPVDGPRSEIELEKVAAELAAAHVALGARQAQLALWLAPPAEGTIVAVGDLGALPHAIDLDAARARLRASHPAPAAAQARIRSLEATLATEKRARIPDFSLAAFQSHELDRDAYGIGLTVGLPLLSWNGGRIAQAEAELEAGRLEAEAVSRELESRVIEAEAACRAAVETAARFGSAVVPRSEAAAATMERTYELGEASLLELIDARRTLLDTRRLHLGALAAAQIECSRLGSLVGEEIP